MEHARVPALRADSLSSAAHAPLAIRLAALYARPFGVRAFALAHGLDHRFQGFDLAFGARIRTCASGGLAAGASRGRRCQRASS